MHDRDCLHRFLFEHWPIRGHIVHLDAAWRALLEHRDYPVAVRDVLGEAVAAAVLLSATLKFDGTLSLQLQGDGPMHLLLAQCTNELAVRAVARYQEATEIHDARSTLPVLAGTGRLAVTLENEDLSQRYQGIVSLDHADLAGCLQRYFEDSEQLPTRLWLRADAQGVSGILLQRLSDDSVAQRATGADSLRASTAAQQFVGSDRAAIDDAWRRVQMLVDTLQPEELRTLTDKDILRRLFAEDDVRMFESAPVSFRCRCSRERVVAMLRGIGAEEAQGILTERGHVEVLCDFCNRAYRFDAVDVAQIFATVTAAGSSGTVH